MKRSFGGFGALAQTSAVIRPGDEISRTDYVGPCVYRDGQMSMVLIAGGYIEVTDSGYAYRYYLSDHQGNVRAVIDQDGALVETNDYYPYGQPMPVAGAASAASAQPYKYGGKELLSAGSDATVSTALAGVYDFGARWHSSLSAAFTQPDPKSETYPAISPYAYCAANPIRYTDPTGEKIVKDDELNDSIKVTIEKLKDSELFKPVISSLTTSDRKIFLKADSIRTNGQLQNDTVTINKNIKSTEIIFWALGEEFYHVYQEITPSEEDCDVNTEFEAKSFVGIAVATMKREKGEEEIYRGGIVPDEGVVHIYRDMLYEGKYPTDSTYIENCNKFIEYNKAKRDSGEFVPKAYTKENKVYPNRMKMFFKGK